MPITRGEVQTNDVAGMDYACRSHPWRVAWTIVLATTQGAKEQEHNQVTGQTVAAWVAAGVMTLTMLGSLIALAFKIGSLSGQVMSFMATSERDRAEQLKDIGRIEERYEKHIEMSHRGVT